MSGNGAGTLSPANLAKGLDACWDDPVAFFGMLADESLRVDDACVARALILLKRRFGRNVVGRSTTLLPTSRDYWDASSPLMQAAVKLADSPAQLLEVLNHFRKGMAGDLAGGCVAECAREYCMQSSRHGGPFSTLPQRLYEVSFSRERSIRFAGLSTFGELVGWALPSEFPPRNGRTSKALYALGYDVKIHTE